MIKQHNAVNREIRELRENNEDQNNNITYVTS
jgi:hypothetical protein